MKKNPLKIENHTVKGIFQLYDQEGFPLSYSLGEICKRNLMVDWGDYFASAKKAGWSWDKVKKHINEALQDCPEYPMRTVEDCARTVFAYEIINL